MTIQQSDRLYEVLVRYNDDGTVAAHQQRVTRVYDDQTGDTISEVIGLPTALATSDVADVIGEALPGIQAQLDAANSQVATLQAQIASDADAATEAQAAQQAALDAAAETAAAKLADMQAQRDALQAQVNTLTAAPAVPEVLSQKFKIVLSTMPSFINQGQTLLDDANALVAASPVATQLRWQYPQFYRNDTLLNQMAALLVPAPNDPSAVLDQAFAAAQTVQ